MDKGYEFKPVDIEISPINKSKNGLYTNMVHEFIASGLKSAWVQVPGKDYLRVYNALFTNIRRNYAGTGVRVIQRGKEVYLWREK